MVTRNNHRTGALGYRGLTQASDRERGNGASTRRGRLYPRSAEVLRRMVREGGFLTWCPVDERYRFSGSKGRSDVVIARTRVKLLKMRALRQGNGLNPDIFITELGRKLLAKYEMTAKMIKARAK